MASTFPAQLRTSLVLFGASLALGFGLTGGSLEALFSARGKPGGAVSTATPSSPGPGARAAAETGESLLTDLMSALAEEEPLRRVYRLQELLGAASPAELARLWTRVLAVPDAARRRSAIAAVLARWAVADPEGARAAVQPYRARFRELGLDADSLAVEAAVEQAWAEARPEEVLAEAAAAAANGAMPRWATSSAYWALHALGQGDPKLQLQILATLPASPLRDDLLEIPLQHLKELDPTAGEAYLALIPNPATREKWRTLFLCELADKDPAASLARLRELAPQLTAGSTGSALANTVLAIIAGEDPASALTALSSLPESLRAAATGAVLIGWARKEPLAALDWARDQGLAVSEVCFAQPFTFAGDESFNWLIREAHSADFDGTFAWIRALPPGAERDTLLRRTLQAGGLEKSLEIFAELTPPGQAEAAAALAANLYRNGATTARLLGRPDAIEPAEKWVAKLPPGAARLQAIRGLSEAQSYNLAPEKVLAQWPAGAERDAALSGVASKLADTTPTLAPEYARRITDPALREDAFEAIVFSWESRGEPGLEAWLKASPDFTPEQKRVLQLLLAEPRRRQW